MHALVNSQHFSSFVLASTPLGDAKQSAFHESRSLRVDENVVERGKHDEIKGNVAAEPSLKGFSTESVEVAELKQTPKTSPVVSSHRLSLKARPTDKCGIAGTFQNTSIISDGKQSLPDNNNSERLLAKTEVYLLNFFLQ